MVIILTNYGNFVVLTIDSISYSDQFSCDSNTTSIISYSATSNMYLDGDITTDPIYRAGIDRIEIEINMIDLPSTFSGSLLNLWICSVLISGDTLEIVDGDEMNSGCFDTSKVDPASFKTVILNGEYLLYDSKINDNTNSSINNIIRFSFVAPDGFSYTE
eukprot:246842_1